MWTIIVFLLLGITIGVFVPFKEKAVKVLSHAQTVGVILLLFVMGLSIGLDNSLLVKLQNIGYKAILFALLTTIFSIIAVFITTRKLLPRRNEQ